MIRVLVADDQSVVREGIRILLEPIEEIKIVGFARDGIEVQELVQKELPDIILLDIEMPKIDGLTLTKKICANCPGTKVIILSTHLSMEYVSKALDLGARGYLDKSAVTKDLYLSIQLVHRGYSCIKYELISEVINQNKKLISQYEYRIKQLEHEQILVPNQHNKTEKSNFFQSSKTFIKNLFDSEF